MTDFEKFYRANFPFQMTGMRDVMKQTEKIIGREGYISPTIMEEREMHVTQMDVFSRLMMDRTIFFGTEVNDYTSNVAIAQLLYLDSIGNEPINMYINSPGGEVYSGLGIVDTMDFIKSPVYTTCTGMAASMGSILLVCGDRGHRSMLKHSRCMIHQPLGGIQGQASDIEITAKEILKLKNELCQIISDRSGQDFQKVINDCDRDYWMTAEETKEYGIIDNVVLRKE